MWSTKTYAFLLTGISGIGTLTNLKCFKYIKKTFDIKGNVFYILAQDCLVTTIWTGLYFITNVIGLVYEDILRSKFGCLVWFSGLFLPCVLGPVSSLMISLRRYAQLKYPEKFPHNSARINRAVNEVMVWATLYFLIYMIVDIIWEMKGFNFMEVCQGNEEAISASKVSLKYLSD